MLSGIRASFSRSLPSLRRFCAEAAEEASKKPRIKQKNLVEVGTYLPDRGLGWKFTRNLWIRNGIEDSYWTITKILEKNKGRIRYYGRLTWKGKEIPRETKVKTWHKRGWRFIPEPDGSKLRKATDGSLISSGESAPEAKPI